MYEGHLGSSMQAGLEMGIDGYREESGQEAVAIVQRNDEDLNKGVRYLANEE